MKSVALIPARGGSKRLPRKNALPFLGKPMMAYSIEAALQSGLFERVVVSTEDAEFAAIAREYGAEVDDRPPGLAGDKDTVASVCQDYLKREEEAGRSYDMLCVLYATAPMRGSADVKAVYDLIEPGVCHYALAVTEYAQPPHQALKRVSEEGDISPMWPELVAKRSDSLPDLLVDNGSTYCVMVEDFKQSGKFYDDTMRGHMMPRWKSVDMDTAEDFEISEFYARKYEGQW